MNTAGEQQEMKPLYWAVHSVKKELSEFPEDVQDVIGLALMRVQLGDTPGNVKPLSSFKGHIWEIRDNYDTDTYRAVYTVHFPKAVYVLHVFKKKSTQGIKTPKKDLDVIEQRFQAAKKHYEETYPDRKA